MDYLLPFAPTSGSYLHHWSYPFWGGSSPRLHVGGIDVIVPNSLESRRGPTLSILYLGVLSFLFHEPYWSNHALYTSWSLDYLLSCILQGQGRVWATSHSLGHELNQIKLYPIQGKYTVFKVFVWMEFFRGPTAQPVANHSVIFCFFGWWPHQRVSSGADTVEKYFICLA